MQTRVPNFYIYFYARELEETRNFSIRERMHDVSLKTDIKHDLYDLGDL